MVMRLGIDIQKEKIRIREAFQSKKQPNLGISPNRGGVVKKSKSPKFQLGKVQN